ERLDGVAAVLVLADREERQVFPLEGGGEGLPPWHLLDARRTPRGPEVQHDDLAAEGGEPDRPALEVGDREVGRDRGPAVCREVEARREDDGGRRRSEADP